MNKNVFLIFLACWLIIWNVINPLFLHKIRCNLKKIMFKHTTFLRMSHFFIDKIYPIPSNPVGAKYQLITSIDTDKHKTSIQILSQIKLKSPHKNENNLPKKQKPLHGMKSKEQSASRPKQLPTFKQHIPLFK